MSQVFINAAKLLAQSKSHDIYCDFIKFSPVACTCTKVEMEREALTDFWRECRKLEGYVRTS